MCSALSIYRKGYDKLLDGYQAFLAQFAHESTERMVSGMSDLLRGGKSHMNQDLVDLYKSGFFSDPDINLREYHSKLMREYYYAMAISTLW